MSKLHQIEQTPEKQPKLRRSTWLGESISRTAIGMGCQQWPSIFIPYSQWIPHERVLVTLSVNCISIRRHCTVWTRGLENDDQVCGHAAIGGNQLRVSSNLIDSFFMSTRNRNPCGYVKVAKWRYRIFDPPWFAVLTNASNPICSWRAFPTRSTPAIYYKNKEFIEEVMYIKIHDNRMVARILYKRIRTMNDEQISVRYLICVCVFNLVLIILQGTTGSTSALQIRNRRTQSNPHWSRGREDDEVTRYR